MTPMVRSNICLNAHPQGCKQAVLNQIEYTKSVKEKTSKLSGTHRPVKNVLVLGCSNGYGLASRISAAFAYDAATIGVSFEKAGTEKKVYYEIWTPPFMSVGSTSFINDVISKAGGTNIFGDINEELPIAKATVSQHLTALKDAGLIQGEIETPKVRYCINKENWQMARELFAEFLGQCVCKSGECCDK